MRKLFATAAVLLTLSACTGGTAGMPTPTPMLMETPKEQVLNVAIGGEDFAIGANRFPIFLFDFDGAPIEGATVEARFGSIAGDSVTVVATSPATYRRVVSEYTHTHPGGTTESHSAGKGFYTVDEVTFDRVGNWAAQVTATLQSGATLAGSAAFEVKVQAVTPSIGGKVPVTRNLTAKDVTDISEIDSSTPPRPELHQVSVASALERQRPFVVVFASPSFCTSRLCGPVTDEVAALYSEYNDRVDFIHIEPYELGPLRSEGAFRLASYTKEWGLPTEPWSFVVDGQGLLVGKFEGLAARGEIEAAVKRMLS